ncbi:MAG: N-6 DNA methylase [Desulfurellaceae bacterium]|nr:N-6 DNA methylase [Desulfurellaceae bacterium]
MPIAAAAKPKDIKDYYAALDAYAEQGVTHEGAVRSAFQNLLVETGRRAGWTLIPELPLGSIRPDGTFRDEYFLNRGYWEAKDTKDRLEAEIEKKRAKGYPLTNTIFEDTRHAYLYQNGQVAMQVDLTEREQLSNLLITFFSYTEPAHEDFGTAVGDFKQRVPDLARGLVQIIQAAHTTNARFKRAVASFFELCQDSLNPNISEAAVDEMLVQHLLTERLIRTIFDSQDFTRRNVIAAEVEKVIDALVSRAFNRHEFLKRLDPFYLAIESAARTITDFSEKQHFLNAVYERFFQGYSIKAADTLGIVYTPQEIVDFMCSSVEQVLKEEFGKQLSDPGVNILDPCTGTGNFVVNLLRRIPRRDLRRVYTEQLFANEVMLLPYYIAALNIEHAYYERTGEYEPFDGLCFVDTLELAEGSEQQFAFMTEENTARVERQKTAPITVIIGNPPYNVGQINENDNNKNRKYKVIDERIRVTYAKDSRASNVNKLSDAYVKFFRWAVERLEERDGIVCFVTNNSFVDQTTFDGVRKNLLQDFTSIYHVDLHGNVRENPKLSGTTHNVFGIQVGVGITVAVRKGQHVDRTLLYHRVPEGWRKEEKLSWLTKKQNVAGVEWRTLQPDERHTWILPPHADEFRALLPIGSRETKANKQRDEEALFKTFSIGVNTNRDAWVYCFDKNQLADQVQRSIETYNSEIDRWKRAKMPKDIDNFVVNDESKLKWSSRLKETFARGLYTDFEEGKMRNALYRPFTKRFLFFDSIMNHRQGISPYIFPTTDAEKENLLICVPSVGNRKDFGCMVTNLIPPLDLAFEKAQCFPFYVYNEDGTNRRENITDWGLQQFRDHYNDNTITKWDVFYYVYGLLHHSGYREKFADNLKRELPRIPFAPDFQAFASAGKQLARLHLEYEDLEPYDLQWIESDEVPLSYRVERLKLSKDKTALIVNDSLTLAGIPPDVFAYRLGNRSALEWVIDQYRVKTDKRSGIRSDPNRLDDEEYIVRLVGQVVRVSLETVSIVRGLPEDSGS